MVCLVHVISFGSCIFVHIQGELDQLLLKGLQLERENLLIGKWLFFISNQ